MCLSEVRTPTGNAEHLISSSDLFKVAADPQYTDALMTSRIGTRARCSSTRGPLLHQQYKPCAMHSLAARPGSFSAGAESESEPWLEESKSEHYDVAELRMARNKQQKNFHAALNPFVAPTIQCVGSRSFAPKDTSARLMCFA